MVACITRRYSLWSPTRVWNNNPNFPASKQTEDYAALDRRSGAIHSFWVPNSWNHSFILYHRWTRSIIGSQVFPSTLSSCANYPTLPYSLVIPVFFIHQPTRPSPTATNRTASEPISHNPCSQAACRTSGAFAITLLSTPSPLQQAATARGIVTYRGKPLLFIKKLKFLGVKGPLQYRLRLVGGMPWNRPKTSRESMPWPVVAEGRYMSCESYNTEENN